MKRTWQQRFLDLGPADISELPGIRPGEAGHLRAANIATVLDLWKKINVQAARLDADYKSIGPAIEQVAKEVSLSPQRLSALLMASVPQPRVSSLPVVAASGLLFFLLLAVRVALPTALPPALRLMPVVVARSSLASGHVLRAEDMAVARATLGSGSATTPTALLGTRLRNSISAGKPLTRDTVERLCYVAKTDLPAGTKLTWDKVALVWKPADDAAIPALGSANSSRAQTPVLSNAVAKGQVLLPGTAALPDTPPPVKESGTTFPRGR